MLTRTPGSAPGRQCPDLCTSNRGGVTSLLGAGLLAKLGRGPGLVLTDESSKLPDWLASILACSASDVSAMAANARCWSGSAAASGNPRHAPALAPGRKCRTSRPADGASARADGVVSGRCSLPRAPAARAHGSSPRCASSSAATALSGQAVTSPGPPSAATPFRCSVSPGRRPSFTVRREILRIFAFGGGIGRRTLLQRAKQQERVQEARGLRLIPSARTGRRPCSVLRRTARRAPQCLDRPLAR